MNIRIQKVGIKVTMRSIAVESKAQRIGQRKELNLEATANQLHEDFWSWDGKSIPFSWLFRVLTQVGLEAWSVSPL